MSSPLRADARGWTVALACVLACACSPAVSAPDAAAARPVQRTAWVGEDPTTGARVVVEALTAVSAAAPVAVTEAQLLRRAAELPPGRAWFRVHELGTAAAGAIGRVIGPQGDWSAPPARAPSTPRDRLLYLALVRGAEQVDGPEPRRTRLVAGGQDAAEALTWERDGARLELRARTWSERERADFLGDSAPSAASESGSTALIDAHREHE